MRIPIVAPSDCSALNESGTRDSDDIEQTGSRPVRGVSPVSPNVAHKKTTFSADYGLD